MAVRRPTRFQTTHSLRTTDLKPTCCVFWKVSLLHEGENLDSDFENLDTAKNEKRKRFRKP